MIIGLKQKLINKAKLLGCSVYQNPNKQWIIKFSTNREELILKEQELDKWLWISKQIPQASLKTKETLEILDKLAQSNYFNRTETSKLTNIAG